VIYHGFIPIIINVTPVSLPLLLGFGETESEPFDAAQNGESDSLSFLDSLNRKKWLKLENLEEVLL